MSDFKPKQIPDFVNIDSKPELFLDFYAEDGKTRIRRPLAPNETDFGFFDSVQIDSRHDGTKVYTYFIEKERFTGVGSDVGYGNNQGVLDNIDNSKLYTIDDVKTYLRPMTTGDRCGLGYYKRTNYYLVETKELMYSCYELIYGYDWVPSQSWTEANQHKFAVNGIPNFLDGLDDVRLKIEKSGTRFNVVRDGNQITCTEYSIIDVSHGDVVYTAWVEVMQADWINADAGYGDNIGTKGAPDFSQNLDGTRFEARESTTEEHRFMQAGSLGDGFYTRVDIYEKASDSIIYSWYRLKDGYPYLGKASAFGTNYDPATMPDFENDSRFYISKTTYANGGYMRRLYSNGRGVGYFNQVQVKARRLNQLYWTYYELAYGYDWADGLKYSYSTGKQSDAFGEYVVPDFINGSYDKSLIKTQTVDSFTNKNVKYIVMTAIDIRHNYPIYKLAVPDFNKSWKNYDIGYGSNGYPEQFDAEANGCYETVVDGYVKRNLSATASDGFGVYRRINLVFKINSSVVYSRYELVLAVDGANLDTGYGVNKEVASVSDNDFNKSFGNVITRPVAQDGSGIGFYKVVKCYPKLMPSELAYTCYEPQTVYSWVPAGIRHDYGVDGIPDFVTTTPEGTTVDRTTSYKVVVDGVSYYSWRVLSIAGYREGVTRTVLYTPYVREYHASNFPADVGYGDAKAGCPDYTNPANHMVTEDAGLISRPATADKQCAIYRKYNIRYVPNNEIIYSYYDVVETFEGQYADSQFGSNTTDATKIWIEDESTWSEGTKSTWKREQGPMVARQQYSGSAYSLWNSYSIIHKATGVVMYHVYKEVVDANGVNWWNTDNGKYSNRLGEAGIHDFTNPNDYNSFVYTVRNNVGRDVRYCSDFELDVYQAQRFSRFCGNAPIQGLTLNLYRNEVYVGANKVYTFWTMDAAGRVKATLPSINSNYTAYLKYVETPIKEPYIFSMFLESAGGFEYDDSCLSHLKCADESQETYDYHPMKFFVMRHNDWGYTDSEIGVDTPLIGIVATDVMDANYSNNKIYYSAFVLRPVSDGRDGDYFGNVSGYMGFNQTGDASHEKAEIFENPRFAASPMAITPNPYSSNIPTLPKCNITFYVTKSSNQHDSELAIDNANSGGRFVCGRCCFVDLEHKRIIGFFDFPFDSHNVQ